MLNAKVVIGAGFGDEGKGLIEKGSPRQIFVVMEQFCILISLVVGVYMNPPV